MRERLVAKDINLVSKPRGIVDDFVAGRASYFDQKWTNGDECRFRPADILLAVADHLGQTIPEIIFL